LRILEEGRSNYKSKMLREERKKEVGTLRDTEKTE
jgi:hypothetical protein